MKDQNLYPKNRDITGKIKHLLSLDPKPGKLFELPFFGLCFAHGTRNVWQCPLHNRGEGAGDGQQSFKTMTSAIHSGI